MMPLALADMGQEYTIRKLSGSPEVKKHLEDLGFVVGGNVTVVSALQGNVIVKVKESAYSFPEPSMPRAWRSTRNWHEKS